MGQHGHQCLLKAVWCHGLLFRCQLQGTEENTRTEKHSVVFLLLLSQVTTSMDFGFLFLVSLQTH